MQIATSTNILSRSKRGERYINPCESIKRCYKVGFRVFDMSLHNIKDEEYILRDENWRQRIDEIKNLAERLGVTFSQAHAPTLSVLIDPRTLPEEELQRFSTFLYRAIEAASILGVKWIIMHTMTDFANNCLQQASKKLTMEFYAPFIEYAKKFGVGVCFENMSELKFPQIVRRYGGAYDELCDLVDTINDPMVGICWDFGHANREKYANQAEALRYVGGRLKALHVNDNYGEVDLHNTPFIGTVDWVPIMQALREIGYKGDFTYELKGATDNLPDKLRDAALRYAYEVAEYLLSLY